MTKKYNEDFENYTKYWICDHVYIGCDVKVRDHCHITGKYRGSVHRDCNINVNLNHKIRIVFHNLRNYDSHLIMQELDKFNFKINIIPNGLEKYMSFNINDKLFIDSFQIIFPTFNFIIRSITSGLTKNDVYLVKLIFRLGNDFQNVKSKY